MPPLFFMQTQKCNEQKTDAPMTGWKKLQTLRILFFTTNIFRNWRINSNDFLTQIVTNLGIWESWNFYTFEGPVAARSRYLPGWAASVEVDTLFFHFIICFLFSPLEKRKNREKLEFF